MASDDGNSVEKSVGRSVWSVLGLETRLRTLEAHPLPRLLIGIEALHTCFKTVKLMQDNSYFLESDILIQKDILFASAQRILNQLQITINHIFPRCSILEYTNYDVNSVLLPPPSTDISSQNDILRFHQAASIARSIEACLHGKNLLRLLHSLVGVISGLKGHYIDKSTGFEIAMPASNIASSSHWEKSMHSFAVFGLISLGKALSREYPGYDVKVWGFSLRQHT